LISLKRYKPFLPAALESNPELFSFLSPEMRRLVPFGDAFWHREQEEQ
jgi:hypothetical protein